MNEATTIIQEWGLDTGLHSKEAVLAALAARITTMLDRDPMGFLQIMYRMDVSEAQLDAAMDAPDAPAVIAELVWNRQVHKSMIRRSTPPRDVAEGEEELIW